jgi:hypothetical protein
MRSAVATTSGASEGPPIPIQPARTVIRPDATIVAAAPIALAAGGRGQLVLGRLEDAALLLLLTLAFPLAILIVFAPVALALRLLIEIGRRL